MRNAKCGEKILLIGDSYLNPLVPCVHLNVTNTLKTLKLKTASLFEYACFLLDTRPKLKTAFKKFEVIWFV